MSIRALLRLLLTSFFLLSALVACNMSDTLPDDGPPISVSEDAARRFLQKNADAARDAAQTGSSRLSVTQEEITSVLALSASAPERLATMVAEDSRQNDEVPDLPNWDILITIEEPQVYFKSDGTIVLRGRIEFRNSFQSFRIVTRPSAQAGTLEFDFVEGTIGSISMPEVIFDQLGNLLAQAILLGKQYAAITELRVEAGTFTIAGQRN